MTWRRLHLRERPSHPEDNPRPHEAMRVPTLISSRALARGISGRWMPRSGGIEDERFFRQQANWCYQLAWQSFDLAVAHKLDLMGNELTARSVTVGQPKGTNSDTHPGEVPTTRLKAEAHLCTESYLRSHHGAGGFRTAAQVPP